MDAAALYLPLKHAHIALVTASGTLFALRGAAVWADTAGAAAAGAASGVSADTWKAPSVSAATQVRIILFMSVSKGWG